MRPFLRPWLNSVLVALMHASISISTSTAFVPSPHRLVNTHSSLLYSSSTAPEAEASPTQEQQQQQHQQQEQQQQLIDDDQAIELPETHPLPPHTFAGMVEAGILERFGNVDRVLESWRLTELGYVHKVPAGPYSDTDTTTDTVDTSMCFQESNSYVPGLTLQPFWNTQEHSWTRRLEKKYKAIREEFLRVIADPDETLQAQGNNIWSGALTEDASTYGVGWKTLVLMDRGCWDPVNVNLFPTAAQAIKDAKVPATEVFFASMEPHSNISPHSDFTNFVLTSHLPLVIPYSGQNQCRLTIADQTREWINGQVMLFDTSLLHDAVNDSDSTRYILMMRVWHPDLTPDERGALQFIYDCLNNPEIVTADSPQVRNEAEELMQQMRAFPMILKGVGAKKAGFGGGAAASSSSSAKKKGGKKKRKK